MTALRVLFVTERVANIEVEVRECVCWELQASACWPW